MAQFASSAFTGSVGNIDAIGDGWVRHAASASGGNIYTNGSLAHGYGASGNIYYYNSNAPSSADYEVSVDVIKKSAVDSSAGVLIRCSSSATTFYMAQYDNDTGLWRLFSRVDGGSFTLLGSYAQSLTIDQPYRLRCRAEGTSIKVFIDDVERISVTNSAITAQGFAGIVVNATGLSPTTDYVLDNFSGDTLAAAANIAPSGIASSEAFGAALFSSFGVFTIAPAGLASAEAFGTAVVVRPPLVEPSGIATAEAFGSSTFTPTLPTLWEGLFSGYFAAQWSMPSAIVHRGDLYVGWTNELGDTGITKHVHGGSTTSFTLKTGPGTPNGHDSCVIGILPDERLLCMWANHNEQMYYRISTNPNDISAFDAQQILSTSAIVSYSNLHYLSLPNKYYLHYRTGSGGGPGDRPCRVRATADGVTWDTERIWISEPGERAYVRSRSNGYNRIDFICTSKHVADVGPAAFGIYYCRLEVDAAGVETFYNAAGTVIGTSAIQPTTDMTFLYDGSTIQGWPWDVTVGRDGHPRVLWARHDSDYENYHFYSRWDGSAWVTTQIGEPQSRLYYTESWSDGALCFDAHNPDVIYRSVQGPLQTGDPEWTASGWDMQVWCTYDNGKTFAKTLDLSTNAAAGFKNCRPVSPLGHDGRDAVIWSAGTIGNWDNFSFVCRGASSERVEIASVTNDVGTPLGPLLELEFAVFDGPLPSRSTKLLAVGTTGFMASGGTLFLPAPGAVSSTVYVLVTDASGTVGASCNAMALPATVV